MCEKQFLTPAFKWMKKVSKYTTPLIQKKIDSSSSDSDSDSDSGNDSDGDSDMEDYNTIEHHYCQESRHPDATQTRNNVKEQDYGRGGTDDDGGTRSINSGNSGEDQYYVETKTGV